MLYTVGQKGHTQRSNDEPLATEVLWTHGHYLRDINLFAILDVRESW